MDFPNNLVKLHVTQMTLTFSNSFIPNLILSLAVREIGNSLESSQSCIITMTKNEETERQTERDRDRETEREREGKIIHGA